VVWEEEHRKQPLFKHLTPVYTLTMGFSSYIFPVCSLVFHEFSHYKEETGESRSRWQVEASETTVVWRYCVKG
jgi:hypothetical protein